jgi:uncharacterized membrane protein
MPRLSDQSITTARLISFSDGVFAIAVTLLVFNLKVPHIPADEVHALLPGAILGMVPNFSTYIITFLLVALYWTFHHRMLNLVTHIDTPFLWMNICYLLSISFIPFPAMLFGSYSSETVSFVFYISSMIVISGLSMLMMAYASYNYRLTSKELPMSTVKYIFFRQFTSIVVFLLSIPIAFFEVRWALDSIFILFPIHWLTRKYFRKYADKGQE